MIRNQRSKVQGFRFGVWLKDQWPGLAMGCLAVLGLCVFFVDGTKSSSSSAREAISAEQLAKLKVPQPVLKLEPQNRPPVFVSAFPKVDKRLRAFSDDSTLGAAVKELLPLLPAYQEEVQSAQKAAAALMIDVILQDHGSDQGLDPQGNQPAYRSQARNLKLLRQNHYDVISVEGFDLSRMTLRSVAQSLVDHFNKNGDELPLNEAEEMVVEKDSLLRTSALQYMQEQPAAFLIGAEYRPLNHVHHIVIEELEKAAAYGGNRVKRFVSINPLLSRLRSELAVAKAVSELRRQSKTRGAIIIGYAHKEDMAEILKAWNVRSTFYSTMD